MPITRDMEAVIAASELFSFIAKVSIAINLDNKQALLDLIQEALNEVGCDSNEWHLLYAAGSYVREEVRGDG